LSLIIAQISITAQIKIALWFAGALADTPLPRIRKSSGFSFFLSPSSRRQEEGKGKKKGRERYNMSLAERISSIEDYDAFQHGRRGISPAGSLRLSFNPIDVWAPPAVEPVGAFEVSKTKRIC
jgi:hypothetical protein